MVIDSLAIAAGTAFVTIIGTRWVDNRRHLAQERGLLAAELRVQLAETHRRANVCVRAWNTAMDTSASFIGDEPAGEFLDAINEFKKSLDHLRLQTSELLVRTDPSVQRGLSEPMTTMLESGERLLRWMRYGEIPRDWGNYEEDFLQRMCPREVMRAMAASPDWCSETREALRLASATKTHFLTRPRQSKYLATSRPAFSLTRCCGRASTLRL